MLDLTWYSQLNQPYLSPTPEVFPVAWTILYLSMFVSIMLFKLKCVDVDKSWGYILFGCQIIVNLFWMPAFFFIQNILLALAIVIILDILVFFNIYEFYKVSKSAARCLIPYFIWILFATYLNIGYLVLN